MKNLLFIAISILTVGCGGKDESTTETKPPEIEKEELPPIPDKVTKEFVMILWDQPNDETNLIDEIKNQGKAGIWIAKRKKGPSKNELVINEEAKITIKFANQRYMVRKVTMDNATAYSAITYDFDKEKYYWWEFGDESPNGEFYTTYEGQIIDDNAIEWNSIDRSDDLNFKIKHFIRSANTIEMMVEASKDNKPLGVAKDNVLWSKELPKK